MNVEIKPLTVDGLVALARLIGITEERIRPLVVDGAKSDPLSAYWYGSDLIALVGFIPQIGFPGTAYLWMESTPWTKLHKTAVGRAAIRTLAQVRRSQYPRVIGHCLVGTRSVDWLKSLGARFGGPAEIGQMFMFGEF